ncbi:MAG: AarF/ABC1/UbiB kinase family protein [Sphaerobacter sp.]|nr:AarF/ABC1/UbiB kinase family protein [Sphaerobacter sp.]
MPAFSRRGPALTHRRRYTQIIAVLSRHGLSWLIDQLGLDSLIPVVRGRFRRAAPAPQHSQPEHLRLALEELGTTFIKLGQILSTRDDLLPPEYIAELSKLREHVVPVPTGAIVATIEASFGRPLAELYADFDPTPMAVASIGQVHAARLRDGTEVVVKVQKPGIAEQVEEDLAILTQLARFAQRRAPLAEAYDLVGLVEEFGWTLRSELDYLREGRNTDQFRRNFGDSPHVVIPIVYWDRTTARVITLQRLIGLRIDDIDALDRAGIDRKALAQRAAELVLKEIFLDRMFHADPHPGNFAVLPDGRIGVYDFGMVGRIDGATRDALLALVAAAVERDAERIIDALTRLGVVGRDTHRAALRRDIQHLIDHYYGLRLGEYRFADIVDDAMTVIRRFRLQLPVELSLLVKTLAMYEGVGKKLDPGFRPFAVAAPYVRRAMVERFLPWTRLPELLAVGDDTLRLVTTAPRRVDRLLMRAEHGDLEVAMRVVESEELMRQTSVLVNRLIAAILTAASLISLSLVMTVYHPPWLIPWLGPLVGAGIVVTLIVGLALAIQVLRGGRPR